MKEEVDFCEELIVKYLTVSEVSNEILNKPLEYLQAHLL